MRLGQFALGLLVWGAGAFRAGATMHDHWSSILSAAAAGVLGGFLAWDSTRPLLRRTGWRQAFATGEGPASTAENVSLDEAAVDGRDQDGKWSGPGQEVTVEPVLDEGNRSRDPPDDAKRAELAGVNRGPVGPS